MQIKLFSGWLGQEILGHNVSRIIRPAGGQHRAGGYNQYYFCTRKCINYETEMRTPEWENGKCFFYLVHTKVRTYLLLHSFINFKYLLSFIYVSVSVRSTQQNNIFKCQWCVYIKLYDDGTRGKLQWNVSDSWKDGTHWQHHHTPQHWPAFNVRWIIPSSAITEEKSPLLWVS